MRPYNLQEICTLITETIQENWMWDHPIVQFMPVIYEDEISFEVTYSSTSNHILLEYVLEDEDYETKIISRVKSRFGVELKYHVLKHSYGFIFYIGELSNPTNDLTEKTIQELHNLGLSAAIV